MLRISVAVLAWIALAAPASAQIACRANQKSSAVVEMMFGRKIGDRIGVSNAAWARFVDREITPRFPGGLSVVDAAGQWLDPAESDANIALVREMYAALEPCMASRVYVNYMSEDDSTRVGDAYGPNLGRLRELKGRYDPTNLFRLNQNIEGGA